ncbi:chemotaxis protein CheW [Leptolyngbya sp. NIES-2104]|uniref:chemotaxis protein CheW n=1 Tax=Leptolyngbya sp. NIES-2104 TaxID=1552121 RepID=UPI0006EC632F|nr:chemotaxis protein CheW [Leptolyngbya sp. NIES-2104]GAP94541.1 purine-binding chemotaxis protein [Leptolyngbya sp. NIES-2104]
MNSVINRSQTSTQKDIVRLIVFTIAGYRLGLPIDQILRVVNCPDEFRVPTSDVLELLPLGQQMISVLNLRSQLSLNPGQNTPESEFLVAAKVGTELCAIRVDAPPDLIEVEVATIRQLPAPYRQGHPLSIASQVVVLPQGKATLAIFLLELKRVLAMLGKV